MRINKYLASLGTASRRKIDEMTEEGRVKINGKTANLGDQIDPQKDSVEVDGEKGRGEGKTSLHRP
jgi:16S rRNA U516 pseudouridylate synthase RsuA-like enzyme